MSTIYYYLFDYDSGNYDSIIAREKYIQIKGKANDAAKAIVISLELIISEHITQYTFEETQAILDQWIDEENAVPESRYQEKINLAQYNGVFN